MIDRIDKMFFEKISTKRTFYDSYEAYTDSVINEIGNILSCRLRDSDIQSPFRYGINDLQSENFSSEGLEKFRINCENLIKKFEPRIKEIEISDLRINSTTQKLEFSISCLLKLNQMRFFRRVITT